MTVLVNWPLSTFFWAAACVEQNSRPQRTKDIQSRQGHCAIVDLLVKVLACSGSICCNCWQFRAPGDSYLLKVSEPCRKLQQKK